MDKKFYEEFCAIRQRTANAIAKALEEDWDCKSYEGTWELLVSYPDYFEDETATAPPDFYRITLHCYILGPGRHYDWDGKSWSEALEKCKKDIDEWTGEIDDDQ